MKMQVNIKNCPDYVFNDMVINIKKLTLACYQ